jgi:hypothetical protein
MGLFGRPANLSSRYIPEKLNSRVVIDIQSFCAISPCEGDMAQKADASLKYL